MDIFHKTIIYKFYAVALIPYCSWVLELPNFDLYTEAIFHPCNYIGICDSYLVEKMWQLGVEKAFFLPDAIELGEPIRTIPKQREFCFITKYSQELLKTEEMTLYGKGYLDSFLHAQRVLYGASILETGLTKRVYQEFIKDKIIPNDILLDMQKLFVADRYLAPVCTGMQQEILLKNNENIMTVYSNYDFSMCNFQKYPYVEEEQERRKIYAEKEFTLVLTPHVFHNAISRDALEVVAAGGFPICGFQKDYAYFFQKDENLSYFTNPSEFSQAIIRYGNNHEERERVRQNVYNMVANGHTYQHRIVNMLEMWEKL